MPFNVGPGELMIVLIIALLMALPILVLVIFARSSRRREQAPGPDPRVVLADRLARREITQDEFETAMRALGLVDPPS